MPTSELSNDKEIPTFAEMLYNMYSFDGLRFTIDALQKMLDSIKSQYPSASPKEISKMKQVLKLEIVTRFCHYAENLAALAITFNSSYVDIKREKLGLFETLGSYTVRQVISFFEKIPERELQYFAKCFGYPPLIIQSHNTQKILTTSCEIIKEEMNRLAKVYLEFRPLYNAYKHGYRVFFGKDQHSNDGIAFIDKGNKQKVTVLDDDTMKEVYRAKRHVEKLSRAILENHKERIEYEKKGVKNDIVNILTFRKPSDPPYQGKELKFTYTSRGERQKLEAEEGNKVYEKFKEELEKEHMEKIVALDIDDVKVIAIAENVEELFKALHESSYSGRLRMRKIGPDEKTGLEYY